MGAKDVAVIDRLLCEGKWLEDNSQLTRQVLSASGAQTALRSGGDCGSSSSSSCSSGSSGSSSSSSGSSSSSSSSSGSYDVASAEASSASNSGPVMLPLHSLRNNRFLSQ